MFWQLLPGLVKGGQLVRLPLPDAEEWLEQKRLFDAKRERYLPPRGRKSAERKDPEIHVRVLHQGLDRYCQIDPDKKIWCASTFMDSIDGWYERGGGRKPGGLHVDVFKNCHLQRTREH